MTYTRINFNDRNDNFPDQYLIDGTVSQVVKDNTGVSVQGTALNSTNLNQMDLGIFEAHEDIDDLATNKGTATDGQVLTSNGDGTSTFETLNLSSKIDKPVSAVSGNIAEFDSNRNVVDSGFSPDDFFRVTSDVFISGSYTGNNSTSRTISLGFNPTAVFVFAHGALTSDLPRIYGGLAIPGTDVEFGGSTAVSITTNGFNVGQTGNSNSNDSSREYTYIAFK